MTDQVSTRVFRAFAPEIREMIYGYALEIDVFSCDDDSIPTTSTLLAALRGELELYAEALHHFYRHNTVKTTPGNLHLFENLSTTSWRSIWHLEFDLQ